MVLKPWAPIESVSVHGPEISFWVCYEAKHIPLAPPPALRIANTRGVCASIEMFKKSLFVVFLRGLPA